MALSRLQHRHHHPHHYFLHRPNRERGVLPFQTFYSVTERVPLYGRPCKFSSLGAQVAFRRVPQCVRHNQMVVAALGDEVSHDKVQWEPLTTQLEEQQQAGNTVLDEAVCWVNDTLRDPMVEIDPVTILRRIMSEKQSRVIQQVPLSQAATSPPIIQSSRDSTNIAFAIISASILIIMTALLQLQRLEKGGDRVGFITGIASLTISSTWHSRMREAIKENLGALLLAAKVGKMSMGGPKGSPNLIDPNAGLPNLVTGAMQSSPSINAEQLANEGIVVGMRDVENEEKDHSGSTTDQNKEAADYGQQELWSTVDTGESGLLHAGLTYNGEPASRQKMELEPMADGHKALIVKHQLSTINSTEIEVGGHTNGVSSAIALEQGFAVLPCIGVTDQLLDSQKDGSLGGLECSGNYTHFRDEGRMLITAQEKNSDLQIDQALGAHWSREKVMNLLSTNVLVHSALRDNNPCKSSNGRVKAWSGLDSVDDNEIDYLHNKMHGDVLIEAVDSSKEKLQPVEQEGEAQETTLFDPISRNKGEEVNFVNDQGLDYMTGGEDLTDIEENFEEVTYNKAGEVSNGTSHELHYTEMPEQFSVVKGSLDLPSKDADAGGATVGLLGSTNNVSTQTIEETETYKALGTALPAVALGVGLVLGVTGGLQVVGFVSLATFISREILWADSRDKLWQDLTSITDRQKLLEFLAKRNVIKRKH